MKTPGVGAVTASASQSSTASPKRRIPREDLPEILRRYQGGETQTEIAREYGVTPAAISNAVKKAKSLAEEARTDAEAASEPSFISEELERSDGLSAELEQAAVITDEVYQSEGAKRLAEVSARACSALDGRHGVKEAAAIKTAIHDVRRALAAIEIELAKAAPAGRPEASSSSRRDSHPTDARSDSAIPARVKFFDQERGFGFVAPESGGDDIYVNAKTLAERGYKTLAPSQEVWVTTKPGRRGPEVADLELVS